MSKVKTSQKCARLINLYFHAIVLIFDPGNISWRTLQDLESTFDFKNIITVLRFGSKTPKDESELNFDFIEKESDDSILEINFDRDDHCSHKSEVSAYHAFQICDVAATRIYAEIDFLSKILGLKHLKNDIEVSIAFKDIRNFLSSFHNRLIKICFTVQESQMSRQLGNMFIHSIKNMHICCKKSIDVKIRSKEDKFIDSHKNHLSSSSCLPPEEKCSLKTINSVLRLLSHEEVVQNEHDSANSFYTKLQKNRECSKALSNNELKLLDKEVVQNEHDSANSFYIKLQRNRECSKALSNNELKLLDKESSIVEKCSCKNACFCEDIVSKLNPQETEFQDEYYNRKLYHAKLQEIKEYEKVLSNDELKQWDQESKESNIVEKCGCKNAGFCEDVVSKLYSQETEFQVEYDNGKLFPAKLQEIKEYKEVFSNEELKLCCKKSSTEKFDTCNFDLCKKSIWDVKKGHYEKFVFGSSSNNWLFNTGNSYSGLSFLQKLGQFESIIVYPVDFDVDPKLHQLMRYEILRIRSYQKLTFMPAYSATQLAQEGFYFSGIGTSNGNVTCFSCGNTHSDFLSKTDLHDAHKKNCKRVHLNVQFFREQNEITSADFSLFNFIYNQETSVGKAQEVTEGAKKMSPVCQPDTVGPADISVYCVYTSITNKEPFLFNPNSTARRSSNDFCGLDNGATIDSDDFLNLRGAAYPQFACHKSRLQSFLFWDPNHNQKPKELVKLGFFYAGYSDCARCFYCGLGLKYWRPEDDAAYQHARFRPHCTYNQFVKGHDFIDQVQREIASENEQGEEASGTSEDDPNISQLMKSDAVKQVLEEGWSRERVKLSLIKLVNILGEECVVYGILLDFVESYRPPPTGPINDYPDTRGADTVASETIQRNEAHDGSSDRAETSTRGRLTAQKETKTNSFEQANNSYFDQDKEIKKFNLDDEKSNSDIIRDSDALSSDLNSDVVLRLLEREHNYLKKRLNCMVCDKAKIGCIYLPCGHVVACITCGDLASTCMLCEKVISAIANIYMS